MGQVLQIASFRSDRAVSTAAPHTVVAPLVFPARVAEPRILVYWHLLSLDAPTVATLWVGFVASVSGQVLPASTFFAMFLAVWLLYAGDRLLDARTLPAPGGLALEARHRFHGRYRGRFQWAIAVAAGALACLLPRLATPALHLYLVEGSLLAAYFVILHGSESAHRLPKEFAVGIFFAAAIFIPTLSAVARPDADLWVSVALFAALCTVNGLYIYSWEHPFAGNETAHPATRLALSLICPLTLALFAVSLAAATSTANFRVQLAVAVSCVLHLVLDSFRPKMSRLAIRAAADALLLTPILVWKVHALWQL